jgi:hypothetical protein
VSISSFSRLILDPRFDKVLEDLNKKNIHSNKSNFFEIQDEDLVEIDTNKGTVFFLDREKMFSLDPSLGYKTLEHTNICAYDESLMRVSSLEGEGFFISHSLVLMDKEQYLPLTYLTFDFFTRSKVIADGNNSLIYTKEAPEIASKRKYIEDRMMILNKFTPDNSILLVDGPLIGSQMTEYNLQLNEELLKRNIMPLFFVKNSNSSLIIDSDPKLRNQYNSDFEWSYKTLQTGEITNFAKYLDKTDSTGRKNKIFTYLKAFDTSPVRVEMHDSVYAKLNSELKEVMSAIYYLLLAQGDMHNPQPRAIAISEKYARATLNVIDFENLIQKTGINPTMNFTRFGW